MNKNPVLLRSLFALLVLFVFLVSMYPLQQSDFYKTLDKLLANPDDPKMKELVEASKAKQAANKGLYASSALEETATDKGISLIDYVKPRVAKSQGLSNNRDVISLVRKNAAGSIRLGIDLNGGAEFLLSLKPIAKPGAKEDPQSEFKSNFTRYRDMAIETLRKRLETQNIFETEITPAGGEYISLRVPIVTKDEKIRLERLIKMSARLHFRLVHRDNERLVQEFLTNPDSFQAPEGYERMEITEARRGEGPRRMVYFVEKDIQMDGKDITQAYPAMGEFGGREILLSFNTEGAKNFGQVTRNNIGRQLAIVLDNNLYSAPQVKCAIEGGHAQITGDFSREEAETISNALVSGSMPFQIGIEGQFDIDPTIGAETVRDGIYSGIAGTLMVIIFMGFYYLRSGMIANISLVANTLMLLGALAAFDVTLTLPGIAGIILTLGMAVDANILIYERIREELANNKTVVNAVELGFKHAFSAIFDSNMTHLFVAAILMWQGTGAIKGFAITLVIGVISTLFTAVFLSKLLFDLMLRYTQVKELKMHHIFVNPNYDFLRWRKPAIIFSIVLSVICIAVAAYRGKDIFSVDFTGGRQITFNFENYIPSDHVSKALEHVGFESKVAYKTTSAIDGGKKKLEVVLKEKKGGVNPQFGGSDAEMKKALTDHLNEKFPTAKLSADQMSSIGSLIGWEFTKSALISLFCAVFIIVIYMTARFQFSYSIAANLAMLHDVIVGVGVYVALGGQLTMQSLAAVMTLIGYSVNDTIVTYDRIRENLTLMKGKTYSEVVNTSVNQTLGRTILTGSTVFMVLLMQFFFGGISIRDFVSIMLVGVITGTYSSIYIAGPLVAIWHKDAGPNIKPEPIEKDDRKSLENKASA